jgi:hypothetical protein
MHGGRGSDWNRRTYSPRPGRSRRLRLRPRHRRRGYSNSWSFRCRTKVAMSAVALDDTPTPASATSATRGENLIFRLKLIQELHERTLAELLYLETKFAASRLLPASPEAININVPAIRLVPVRVLAADGPNRRVSGIVANRTCVTLRRFGAQSIRQTYAEV